MARKSKAQRRGPSGGADIRTPAQLAAEKAEAAQTPAQRSRRGGRETVDSLVVAFVWAFLIRTFISELFVIPTGSMAPTLMGRHKDVVCQESGQRFRVNSSDDAADQAAALQAAVRQGRISASDARARIAGLKCVGGESPQARLVTMLDDRGAERYRPEWQEEVETNPDYSGDRVLVSKWAYSFSDPQRWDVVVFKYPGNSQTNYIKRVVALPGEDLRIFQGDLFTRPACEPDFEFQIARKPPEQVLAMRQRV
ncbi:MAG: signal peptidase I, partial [Planctomycetota bacterium]